MNTKDELDRVLWALNRLTVENPIWQKNQSVFSAMNDIKRNHWWQRAKKQAELGAPAMKTLLLKVIELRLTQ